MAQTFQVGGSTFLDLVINNTGPAAVTPNGVLTIRNLTLTLGTLVMGGNALNVSGNWVRTGGAATSTGTVTFNGAAAQAFNPAGSTLQNLTINNTGPATVTLGGALDLGGTLTLTSGTLAAGAWAVNVGRELHANRPGVFTSGGTLTFDGTVAQTFQVGGSTFLDLVINNTGAATVTPNGALTIRNLTLTLGTLAMGGNALNVVWGLGTDGWCGDLDGDGDVQRSCGAGVQSRGLDAAERDDQQHGACDGDAGRSAGPRRDADADLRDAGRRAWAVNVGGNFMRTARGLHLGGDADV